MLHVCPEINAVLNFELSLGNEIASVDTSWGDVKQSFQMKKPMSELTKKQFIHDASLLYWESRDPHYSLENGFNSKAHSEDISFPLIESKK